MKGQTNQERIIYPGRTFTCICEQVELPNGTFTEIEMIRHPGAAAVVPVLEDSRIVLIKQYRHAVGRWIWEIPAGTLSSGEDPKECAKRELAEETGFRVGCLEKIGEIAPVPDYSDDIIHIFLGTDLKPGPQALQEDEFLRVKELSITNAIDMIMIGKITDAKTIIGILLTNFMMYDRNSEVMSVKKRK